MLTECFSSECKKTTFRFPLFLLKVVGVWWHVRLYGCMIQLAWQRGPHVAPTCYRIPRSDSCTDNTDLIRCRGVVSPSPHFAILTARAVLRV